jgi:DNA polymerase-3 subunit delta'
MSQAPERGEPRLPRETTEFFGHAEAENALLEAYRSGRLAHAWLLAGCPGVGKATLAYRMARFVLAYPDHSSVPVRTATSLRLDPDHAVARRIAARSHGDLLVLERTINDKTGRLRQEIQVDEVRKSVNFFGATAAEGGWRVAIVDSLDELNNQGANALLKVVEEPPRNALLLLVSHSAGRVLPTIRSRCRALTLRPLGAAEVARAAAAAIGAGQGSGETIAAAAAAAEGSVQRALVLLEGDALDLRNSILSQLDRLPVLEPRALHALGERLHGTDPTILAAFVDTVNGWLAGRLVSGRQQPVVLERIAAAYEAINKAAREVGEFNLDRKPLVFNAFARLAEALRR